MRFGIDVAVCKLIFSSGTRYFLDTVYNNADVTRANGSSYYRLYVVMNVQHLMRLNVAQDWHMSLSFIKVRILLTTVVLRRITESKKLLKVSLPTRIQTNWQRGRYADVQTEGERERQAVNTDWVNNGIANLSFINTAAAASTTSSQASR